jgi:fatty-acyl-CoA synthase
MHDWVEGETVPTALRRLAETAPRTRWAFPTRGTEISAAQLHRAALRRARGLVHAGVQVGERVGLLAPAGPDMWTTTFGIMAAGAAVTTLPVRPMAPDPGWAAHQWALIADSAGMRHVVVDNCYRRQVSSFHELRPTVRILELAELDDGTHPLPDPEPDALAVVQYTSGSTAAPKGVALPHRTVLAGLRALLTSCAATRDDVLVQWVPHFHDMGFFGTLAFGLGGCDVHVFRPLDYVRSPVEFLRYAAGCRATHMMGPNFAYDLLVDDLDQSKPGPMALNSLRTAFNGAELVLAETLRRSAVALAPHGVGPSVLYPVYGLAEATLAAAFPPPGSVSRVVSVDRDLLAEEGIAHVVPETHERARTLVCVGEPVDGLSMRIAGPDGCSLGEARLGEIQLKGNSVSPGYLGPDGVSAPELSGGWRPTGDLGFWFDGGLYIAGRTKEMIICHGRNIFPEDIEALVRPLDGVHRRRCVAFARVDRDGAESVVVAAESRVHRCGSETERLSRRIRRAVAENLGVGPVRVLLVPPGALPRTSSGKFQRSLVGADVDERARTRRNS